MSEQDKSSEACPSKNAFVQKVIAAFKQSSPEMRVRDLEQPAHGSLRREEQKETSLPESSLHNKSQIVLMCKALRNEELLPTATSEVDLRSISISSLMQRRRATRSFT